LSTSDKTEFYCRQSKICKKVGREIERALGVKRRVCMLSPARARPKDGVYYLLQRWKSDWKSFINVDSLQQIEDQDKLVINKVDFTKDLTDSNSGGITLSGSTPK